MVKSKYRITGMTCASCVSSVEKAVMSLSGTKTASVSLLKEQLVIEYDDGVLTEKAIFAAVRKKGYGILPLTKKDDSTESGDKMAVHLILSAVLSLLLVYISMGGMLRLPYPDLLEDKSVSGIIQLCISLIVAIINRRYFIIGFKRLLKLDPNMDSLISLGSFSSIVYSAYILFELIYREKPGDFYFDSSAMILTLVTLGKFLEAKSRAKTSKALHGIESLCPEYSTVIREGKEMLIKTRDILIGDRVLVRSGENIPADGIIAKGTPCIDSSVITGESIPLDLEAGCRVSAGTTNKGSPFEFIADCVGSETTLGTMISLIEDASATKAPVSRLADRIAGIFVPAVCAIAAIVFGVTFILTDNFESSTVRCISILVIACPCSLGLATPTAITVSAGKGASLGILFKSSGVLENLSKIDTVVFDKTGTVTKGILTVRSVESFSSADSEELLSLAYSLERYSEHPVGKAICSFAEDKRLPFLTVRNICTVPGSGIEGEIGANVCSVGKPSFTVSDDKSSSYIRLLEGEGKTVVCIKRENRLLGIISLSDEPREDSAGAVSYLLAKGIDVIMMTGDNPGAADSAAKSVGIGSVISSAKPEDKEKKIRELQSDGHTVAMIGDGINDAPALVSADIGIAVGSGTDIAMEKSDIVLVGGRLGDFTNAHRLSLLTMKIIKQNLFWAFFYNSVAISLAAFGSVSPVIASAAMSFSSVCVVLNALRINLFKPEKNSPGTNEPNDPGDTIKQINKGEKTEKVITKEIIIEGMMCTHCSGRVEKALNAIEGVSAKVELENKKAIVSFPEEIPLETLKKAVTEAGYEVTQII